MLKSSLEEHSKTLTENLNNVESYTPPKTYLTSQWAKMKQSEEAITTWDTGVDIPLLQYIGMKSVEFPENFVSLFFTTFIWFFGGIRSEKMCVFFFF